MKRLTMLAAALLAASAFAEIRAVKHDMYGGNTNAWQLARHRAISANAKTNGAKVVFIGDSITHFWEGNGSKAWAKYFAEGPRKASNLGISADRTEHVLWRLNEGGALDGYEAKVVLVMIGTNNSGHHPFAKEPPVDTIYGIRRILDTIAAKQPNARVILQAIFPCGATEDDSNRRRNAVVNREIARFADGQKVIWCDFTDKFLDARARLSPEIFPDYLHPNALGYEIWASAVVPLIDRCLAAKSGECIPSVWPSAPAGYSFERCAATRPTPGWGICWWDQDRLLQKRNEIVDGPEEYDVVMVGDSITHRWEREGGEGRELFAELKKTYRILNLGIGGDQTQHVLWRLTNGDLEGYKAKLFTVMIGTNNGSRWAKEKDIAAGVKAIVELIRRKHPEAKVVLMPIFPRGEKPTDFHRVLNDKVNAIIKSIPDGKSVLWLDFNDKFLKPDGTLTREVMDDLLHPNARGYRIWADALLPVFREHCGK